MKAGQLLAEIDTPEIDDQLQQARADLATAQASYQLGAIDRRALGGSCSRPTRYRKQETDEKRSDTQAKKAVLDGGAVQRGAAGEAAVIQEDLCAVRRRDHGAQHRRRRADRRRQRRHRARSCSTSPPPTGCAYMSACRRLYSRDAVPGTPAELTLAEFPDRALQGQRSCAPRSSIDAATRTLLAEVDVDNRKGELLPGSYAQVHLKLKTSHPGAGAAGQHAAVPLRGHAGRRGAKRIRRSRSARSCSGAISAPRWRSCPGWTAHRVGDPQSVGFADRGTQVRVITEAPKAEKPAAPPAVKT